MDHCGLDLGRKSSRYCILDERRQLVREGPVRNTPVHLGAVFRGRAPMRVVIEATTQSFWVAEQLAELGHDVRVVDPNRTKAIGASLIKHDRLDARILAQLCAADLLAEVRVPARAQRLARVPMVSRDALVRARISLINALRGICASEGVLLPQASPARLVERLDDAQEQLPQGLYDAVVGLADGIVGLNVCIDDADRTVANMASSDPVLRRLQTVPGVGPITAAAFVAALGDPGRFRSGRAVGAYLGLVPRLYQSGATERRGRITNHGNRQARWALTMAASSLLRSHGEAPLQRWARQLATRVGRKKACCAVARKLAALLWVMWRDGTTFNKRLCA